MMGGVHDLPLGLSLAHAADMTVAITGVVGLPPATKSNQAVITGHVEVTRSTSERKAHVQKLEK